MSLYSDLKRNNSTEEENIDGPYQFIREEGFLQEEEE
jgi:hypothetical protein